LVENRCLFVAKRLLLPEVFVAAISQLDLKNNPLQQIEPQHQSAVSSFSLLTNLLHHTELSFSDLQQPLIRFFLVFQVSCIFLPSTCSTAAAVCY